MSDRPDRTDFDTVPPRITGPAAWMPTIRITKEQLAAAERALEHHVRKMRVRTPDSERPPSNAGGPIEQIA